MTTLSASCLAVLMVVGLQGCSAKRNPANERVSSLSERQRNSSETVVSNIAKFRDHLLEEYVKGPPSTAKLTADGFAGMAAFSPRVAAIIESKNAQSPDLFQEEIDSDTWARAVFKVIEKIAQSSPDIAFSNEFLEYMFFQGALEGLDPVAGFEDDIYSLQVSVKFGDPSCRTSNIDIGRAGDELRVTSVNDFWFQSCAPLKKGDIISRIDDVPTVNMKPREARDRIEASTDHNIVLSISRNGSPPFDVTLPGRREKTSITGDLRGDIAYIRVTRIAGNTPDDILHFSDFIGRFGRRYEELKSDAQIKNTTVHGLILDIRNNHGGIFDFSIALADFFLNRGMISRQVGREKRGEPFNYTQRARSGDSGEQVPMVVLIDGETASGAEIVAAALQDNARALIVGSSSFGAGNVRTVFEIYSGGRSIFPTSTLFSPSGRPIDKTPIVPDVCTSRFWDNPTRILEDAKTGRYDPTKLLLRKRQDYKSFSDADEAALKNLCPQRVGDPTGQDTDIEVATRLLSDPELMRKLIGPTQPN